MKLRFHHFAIILLAVTVLSSSCSDRSGSDAGASDSNAESVSSITHTTSERYMSSVFSVSHGRVFRTVDLDMPLKAVREAENDSEFTLAGETDNYLHYEQDLNIDTVKGVDYVELKYIFDDLDRLDIITVNYYIHDSLVNNDLFGNLNTAFNEQYGDYYIDSDGYTVWESSYKRDDTTDVAFDIGIRKLVKLNDPGITIEMMRFGAM